MECPTCGRTVADDASACPDCGADLEKARRLAIRARMQARGASSEEPDAVDRFVSGAILVEKPADYLDRHGDD